MTAAFQAHPYHRPTIGWMSDLNSFSATDAQNFFDQLLHPFEHGGRGGRRREGVRDSARSSRNISAACLPSPTPDERTTIEPPQNSERRVVLTTSRAAVSISRATIARLPSIRMTPSTTRSPT